MMSGQPGLGGTHVHPLRAILHSVVICTVPTAPCISRMGERPPRNSDKIIIC